VVKTNRSYSNEFKSGAIKLALSSNSVREAAKSLRIPVGTLHIWFKNAKKNGRCKVSTADGIVNQILEENQQLKKT
jgi:transposase-like protein